ncbi:MAG: tetratricopeptide repeat protein [Muribaculaceae bacterium]|nr:tetratricopeptide repeat protein [Muribaculaceae bacterium]
MRYRLYFFSLISAFSLSMVAQQQVIDGVKRSISDLSASAATYKSALTRLKPALSHESTKEKAETWWLAGKIAFDIYDKMQHTKAVGNKVDEKEMATYLTQGYNYCKTALRLDSVPELNHDGSPKVDRKTRRPLVKTKYSADITAKLLENLQHFASVGGELYNSGNWNDAWNAWEAYHEIAISAYAREKKKVPADTLVGKMRFYQGLAAFQSTDYLLAHQCFSDARIYGYRQKAVFDNDLNVLVRMGDTTEVVNVAREAYQVHGAADIQYLRILINDHLNKLQYKDATSLLDQAIKKDPTNAEYYNLKGVIIEQEKDFEAALPLYLKAIEADPYYAVGQYDVGRCYYLRALELIKNNSNLSRGTLNDKVNPVFQQALFYLENAYELNTNDPDVIKILKDIYYRLGMGEQLQELER